MKLKPINQQVVAVVGASSGIGRDTALKFASRGAKVVVSARSEPGLSSLVEEIRGFGGEVTAAIADVTVFEQVKAIADKAVEVYGRLDTWVHCPAIVVFASFDNTTPEEFQRVIDVSLMGQVYGAMAALPHLKLAYSLIIDLVGAQLQVMASRLFQLFYLKLRLIFLLETGTQTKQHRWRLTF